MNAIQLGMRGEAGEDWAQSQIAVQTFTEHWQKCAQQAHSAIEKSAIGRRSLIGVHIGCNRTVERKVFMSGASQERQKTPNIANRGGK